MSDDPEVMNAQLRMMTGNATASDMALIASLPPPPRPGDLWLHPQTGRMLLVLDEPGRGGDPKVEVIAPGSLVLTTKVKKTTVSYKMDISDRYSTACLSKPGWIRLGN